MEISNPFKKKDILEETFGFDRLQKLQHALAKQTGIEEEEVGSILTASDFVRFIDRKITSLRQRLVTELDHPSWGPKGSQKTAKKAQDAEFEKLTNDADQGADLVAVMSNSETESQDGLVKISQNLDQSERYFHFSWLYLGAAVIGLMVMGGALFVDYQIMNEFWTRILANEFLEVPSSLSNSVISKSAQVIFATAAFHFFLNKLPEFGRTAYITIFFALTAIMITGFGFLNANISMPTDPESMIISAEEDVPSMNDALVAMGLAEPDQPVIAAPVESTARISKFAEFGYFMEDARPLMWMLVPGLVFLVVTGIGALSLQVAEHNVQNFVKSLDYLTRNKRTNELDELTRFKAIAQNMQTRAGQKPAANNVFTAVPRQSDAA
jgi:hypothetical protein